MNYKMSKHWARTPFFRAPIDWAHEHVSYNFTHAQLELAVTRVTTALTKYLRWPVITVRYQHLGEDEPEYVFLELSHLGRVITFEDLTPEDRAFGALYLHFDKNVFQELVDYWCQSQFLDWGAVVGASMTIPRALGDVPAWWLASFLSVVDLSWLAFKLAIDSTYSEMLELIDRDNDDEPRLQILEQQLLLYIPSGGYGGSISDRLGAVLQLIIAIYDMGALARWSEGDVLRNHGSGLRVLPWSHIRMNSPTTYLKMFETFGVGLLGASKPPLRAQQLEALGAENETLLVVRETSLAALPAILDTLDDLY